MTEQHELEPIVHDWLHHTLETIPDPTHRYGLVAAEVNQTPQQRTWLPTPLGVQHMMWSTTRSIVAISIVALFGGILLFGALTTQQEGEEMPATATGFPGFPTGVFVADKDDTTLILRADGSCERAGVPCTFGVTGKLFSEMAFEESSGPQKPATYYWDFDGEQLIFEPWGPDQRPDRGAVYADHVFSLVSETAPLTILESDLPIGVFVPVGDGNGQQLSNSEQLSLRANGTVAVGGIVGKYAVNGDFFTEMTHNSPISEKVPATYYWRWDGERLTFRLWGEDRNAARKSAYVDHVYIRAKEPEGPLRSLLLSDPRVDYWVRVEISELVDGHYEATATIDGEPLGEGTGGTQREAVRAALESLGEPYASDMADNVTG